MLLRMLDALKQARATQWDADILAGGWRLQPDGAAFDLSIGLYSPNRPHRTLSR